MGNKVVVQRKSKNGGIGGHTEIHYGYYMVKFLFLINFDSPLKFKNLNGECRMLSSVAQIDLPTLNDLVAEVKHILSINQSIKKPNLSLHVALLFQLKYHPYS